tara:strand:+ start:189 stop:1094 length:906 start_codon:yes stop_codon:yes gene_type:complete
MMSEYHEPVLLKESINGLNIKESGIYIDATFGGGGHSRELLSQLKKGRLIAFDQDQDSLKNIIQNDHRFTMINKNFRNLKKSLSEFKIFKIDGLIADLGVSSHQFSDNNRGFSIQYNSILDMRMDQKSFKTGCQILNEYSQQHLNKIFKEYSDFKNPNKITREIINYRDKKSIATVFDFKNIFQEMIPNRYANKFFARLFQAIRIEVNDEINALKDLLNQTKDLLVSSGRVVIISYHSVEDKIVKKFMKYGRFQDSHETDFFGNQSKTFKVLTKKPIVADKMELKMNNKSRSAKMRICEKI